MYISFTYGINIVQFSDTLCFHKRVKCCMNINSFMLKEGCFAFFYATCMLAKRKKIKTKVYILFDLLNKMIYSRNNLFVFYTKCYL